VPRLGDWLARGADASAPVVDHEAPDERRNASEALMLGLRLSEGIAVDLERRAVALDPARAAVIASAIAGGLLERAAGRLRFTARGMMLANETLERLI
jgi:coproporphyrinogen III oxidase-like Fe-S oxidoreductase